jgi:hypothetical protein
MYVFIYSNDRDRAMRSTIHQYSGLEQYHTNDIINTFTGICLFMVCVSFCWHMPVTLFMISLLLFMIVIIILFMISLLFVYDIIIIIYLDQYNGNDIINKHMPVNLFMISLSLFYPI